VQISSLLKQNPNKFDFFHNSCIFQTFVVPLHKFLKYKSSLFEMAQKHKSAAFTVADFV